MGGMSRPVRWGFWGAGAVAHLVAQDLRRVAGAQAVAVASRSAASANAFASAHGIARFHADMPPTLFALAVVTLDVLGAM